MLDQLMLKIREYGSSLNDYSELFNETSVASRTILVKEGDILRNIYFVKKGCLRLWFNNQGKDITFQFFFENQVVSGFVGTEKSIFNLESLEPSVIVTVRKSDFEKLLTEIPGLKDEFLEFVTQRLAMYSKLFLTRIKDNPKKRYDELLKDNPEILKRIPQHYIASYLGITSVSLSRIRSRKK
jgi:CRP-like cAMP-binding protein